MSLKIVLIKAMAGDPVDGLIWFEDGKATYKARLEIDAKPVPVILLEKGAANDS